MSFVRGYRNKSLKFLFIYKTLLNNDIYILVMIQNPSEGNISDSSVNLNFPSYKKILVTHDGSEMSNKALLHAIFLTKIANAELVIEV